MPSIHTLTRREVLGTALVAGALGGDAAAQESDSGSDEATPAVGGTDWPTFQAGPRNTGHAPSARGPVDDGEVAWSRVLGPAGFAAPAAVDGTVYVGTLEGAVVALAAGEGRVAWEFQTESDVVSSPAVDDDLLYVGSTDGRVYALRADDGTLQWSVGTEDRIQSAPAVADVASPGGDGTPSTGRSGAAGERTVFVGSDDGTLYALGAADGSVRWTYDVGSPVGSPAIGTIDDGSADADAEQRVYVGGQDGGVYALSAADGTERWTVDVGGGVGAPTLADDTVYVDAAADGLHALSAVDGTERWRFTPDGPVASPAVAGDSLYVTADDDGVYALSTSDGSELWYERHGGDLRSPAVAGAGPRDSSAGPAGTVFVVQATGGVLVRALSAGDGDQRWAVELQRKRASAPAVVGETLFVNAGEVVAIDEAGRTPTPTGTPWDAEVVLDSWAPTVGTWLGTYVGVPAVLGALVYALGRFGRGDDATDGPVDVRGGDADGSSDHGEDAGAGGDEDGSDPSGGDST